MQIGVSTVGTPQTWFETQYAHDDSHCGTMEGRTHGGGVMPEFGGVSVKVQANKLVYVPGPHSSVFVTSVVTKVRVVTGKAPVQET